MSSDRAYVEGLVPVVAVQDITRPGSPGPDRDFRVDDPDGYCGHGHGRTRDGATGGPRESLGRNRARPRQLAGTTRLPEGSDDYPGGATSVSQ